MSFGKIYGRENNGRTNILRAIVRENKLDVEFVMVDPKNDPEYVKKFGVAKTPALECADGFLLSESIAIAIYCKYFCRDALFCSIVKMHCSAPLSVL